MADKRTTTPSGGPQTEAGKARAMANLRRGVTTNPNGGRISESIRDILRQGLQEAAPKLVDLANGRAPQGCEHMPDPNEYVMLKAIEACAKYALPELKSVVEERLIYDVADVLAANPKIPFECIGEITAALIAKWSPEPGA